MRHFTTGEVANLLSVTRDTVLKWVKQGRLPARKTAGGHFRIPEEGLQQLANTVSRTEREDEASPHLEAPIYCWEFFARDGKTQEQCRNCLVYKVKGTKCYEVSEFLRKTGFGATCCPSDCDSCDYYKLGQRRLARILIFTQNEHLKESLLHESESSRIDLKFTQWDFDCSFVIDSFRPEYVIVDCEDDFKRYERLTQHLKNDPRIPGVRILLGVPWPRKLAADFREDPTVIGLPFTIIQLEEHLKKMESFQLTHPPSFPVRPQPNMPDITASD